MTMRLGYYRSGTFATLSFPMQLQPKQIKRIRTMREDLAAVRAAAYSLWGEIDFKKEFEVYVNDPLEQFVEESWSYEPEDYRNFLVQNTIAYLTFLSKGGKRKIDAYSPDSIYIPFSLFTLEANNRLLLNSRLGIGQVELPLFSKKIFYNLEKIKYGKLYFFKNQIFFQLATETSNINENVLSGFKVSLWTKVTQKLLKEE